MVDFGRFDGGQSGINARDVALRPFHNEKIKRSIFGAFRCYLVRSQKISYS